MEADYDKRLKESQTQEGISVTWDMGLNQKRVAWFSFAKLEELRLAVGDELRIRYNGELRKPWECTGHVIKLPNSTYPLYLADICDVYFSKAPETNSVTYNAYRRQ